MKPPSGPFRIRVVLARPAPPAPRPEAGAPAGGSYAGRGASFCLQISPALQGRGEVSHMAGARGREGGSGEFCTEGRKHNNKKKKQPKKTYMKTPSAPNFLNEPSLLRPSRTAGRESGSMSASGVCGFMDGEFELETNLRVPRVLYTIPRLGLG